MDSETEWGLLVPREGLSEELLLEERAIWEYLWGDNFRGEDRTSHSVKAHTGVCVKGTTHASSHTPDKASALAIC